MRGAPHERPAPRLPPAYDPAERLALACAKETAYLRVFETVLAEGIPEKQGALLRCSGVAAGFDHRPPSLRRAQSGAWTQPWKGCKLRG